VNGASSKWSAHRCLNCGTLRRYASKIETANTTGSAAHFPKIKHLAGEGLERPSTLTTEQVRELAASVMAHIEPRKPAKKKTNSRKMLGTHD
jgi:hypothetical protein